MTGIAQNKTSSTAPGSELPRLFEALAAHSPLGLSTLLLLADLLLWGRRLSGAFDHALPTAGLWIAGVSLAGGGEFLRQCLESSRAMYRHATTTGNQAGCYPLAWLPILGVWSLAAAISLPGSSWPGLAGLWICLTLSGIWAVRQQRRPVAFSDLARREAADNRGRPAIHEPAALPVDEISQEDRLSPDEDLSPDVVQQLTRRKEPDGAEWITGVVRVGFEAGQKTAHAHVAFCPPFPTVPSCEAEPVSGPDADLKIAQVLPQGARFDVRLAELPTEPVDLRIEFAAHWQPSAE